MTADARSVPVPIRERVARPASDADRHDALLVSLISLGDGEAVGELYERYRLRALAIAYRVTNNAHSAEEIAQEAFVSIWRHAGTYRPELGPARPWICAIVQNAAIDALRQSKDAVKQRPLEEAWMSPSTADVFSDAYSNVRRLQVWECMQALPAAQRSAIEWVYFGDRTFVEVSRTTGVPIGTLKSRVRLGVSKLRRMLANVA